MPTICIYKKGARKRHYRKNEDVLLRISIVNTHIAVSPELTAVSECGLYNAVVSPRKTYGIKAHNLIAPLRIGLSLLREKYDGSHLYRKVLKYLEICRANPDASIRVEGKSLIDRLGILPRNPERSAMLRKLVEAKDCAVRASIYKDANAK